MKNIHVILGTVVAVWSCWTGGSSSSSFTILVSAFSSPPRLIISPRRQGQGLVAKQPQSQTPRYLGNTKEPPTFPLPTKLSYGEESRKYRRTIYTHDDWVKHRSPTRFFQRAMTTLQSGIYANILRPVLFCTSIACFTVIWNALTGSYTNFQGVTHPGLWATAKTTTTKYPWLVPLVLPMAPFTLSSASLGLLLVFRTNTGYARWDEARKAWGLNINRTRDLLRMAVAWYDHTAEDLDDSSSSSIRNNSTSNTISSSPTDTQKAAKLQQDRQYDLTVLAQCTWAFVRCMKRHLSPDSDEDDFVKEVKQKLPKPQAQAILHAKHRPNRALFDLSVAIENLPMHFLRKLQMHAALTMFEDNLGASERLLSSPVPLFYSRHTARFLLFWTSLLPLALYGPMAGTSWNRILLIPTTFFLSTFLYGIEELANQMEEPFTILPMQAFCDRIYNWCMEMTAWKPGDNGMKVTKYKSSQQAFLSTGYYNHNHAKDGGGGGVNGATTASRMTEGLGPDLL